MLNLNYILIRARLISALVRLRAIARLSMVAGAGSETFGDPQRRLFRLYPVVSQFDGIPVRGVSL